MLNKDGQRELCYVTIIDAIEPIEGSDNCECAVVGGWHVMTRKGTFKPGDPAIYFEIDSRLDDTNSAFAFLATKHYKVKTQKYTFGGKGNFISQGLLMTAEDLGWKKDWTLDNDVPFITDDNNNIHYAVDESRFLTKQLKVTYAVAEDNVRKANSVDKYKRMVQRHGKLFSHQLFRWLMKKEWGRKLLFVFFGKKKDRKNWPAWVQKTDEERVQNIPWILKDKTEWIATEKIDGTSTTFTIKRNHWPKKNEFYICSRNVVFDKPDRKCFYETNIYTEMAEKYHMEEVLNELLNKFPTAEWITIQGETYGEGVQKREYSLKGHDFAAFNLIMSNNGRWNSEYMQKELSLFNIPCVPILDTHYILPDTIEEILDYATDSSKIDGGMREGVVFRDQEGLKSFKAVSNDFLLKYHQ